MKKQPVEWFFKDVPTGHGDETTEFSLYRVDGSRTARPGPGFERLTPLMRKSFTSVVRATVGVDVEDRYPFCR